MRRRWRIGVSPTNSVTSSATRRRESGSVIVGTRQVKRLLPEGQWQALTAVIPVTSGRNRPSLARQVIERGQVRMSGQRLAFFPLHENLHSSDAADISGQRLCDRRDRE